MAFCFVLHVPDAFEQTHGGVQRCELRRPKHSRAPVACVLDAIRGQSKCGVWEGAGDCARRSCPKVLINEQDHLLLRPIGWAPPPCWCLQRHMAARFATANPDPPSKPSSALDCQAQSIVADHSAGGITIGGYDTFTQLLVAASPLVRIWRYPWIHRGVVGLEGGFILFPTPSSDPPSVRCGPIFPY